MGLDATGWTPTTAGERIAQLRADYDAAAGQPLDYVQGSPEAAETVAYGVMAARVESDASVLIDALSPETADGANLDRIGAFRGLPRKAATPSRYVVYPVLTSGATSATIPAGSVLRDADRQLWQTVADEPAATAATPLAVEAMLPGPLTLSTGSLAAVTAVVGVASYTYDSGDGDPYQIGRLAESNAQYRVRLRSRLSLAAGASAPGIRTTLLSLPWLQAADAPRSIAGVITPYVYPGPVGDDQRQALGLALLSSVALGIATSGGDSETVTLDGVTDTMAWTVGTDLPVTVAITVVLASGYALVDVGPVVADAVGALISGLARGGALRILQIQGTIAPIAGVIGVSAVLLNGSAADVVPPSTSIVVLSGSVTVST